MYAKTSLISDADDAAACALQGFTRGDAAASAGSCVATETGAVQQLSVLQV
jgi:hypothetical protein